jgi:hypothetical protein
MAKSRKRKSPRKSRKGKGATKACKTLRIKGQGMRKICRDSRGRITSNKKA